MSKGEKRVEVFKQGGPMGFVLFLAYIGAAVYFVHQSSGDFGGFIWALIKAIAWPAILLYHGFTALGV